MLTTTCLNQVLFVCPLLFSCGFSVLHSAAMSVLFILLFFPAPLPFSYLPDAQQKCCDLLLPITLLILSIFLPALCSCSASSVQQSLSSHFLLHCCLLFHHVLLFFSCYLPLFSNLLLYLCLSDSQFDVWSACHNLISVLPPTLLTPAL